ncbi:hypothetical protein FRACYDRAFT_249209 [Fragilariopsis cylindrus CCMP1102]|uniref:Uncharacterized protein n=1 Tax=Fragilariopsis cylindrus CCMP1102 TaxID=635003 RepID=A0A1E7ESU0_9STRA|nr:hypothetical protein FRACYDRAFT_249209 [Fragilariopsis cylindrus CCMP1102]|eukprot:OEU08864.1 hypothetical protein FRACYDRAFT_249209 [Fragilariopsis cylindrus CCMP1102]
MFDLTLTIGQFGSGPIDDGWKPNSCGLATNYCNKRRSGIYQLKAQFYTNKMELLSNQTQQLLMRVVLGGDFTKQPPQGLVKFKLHKNAPEPIKNSNLKLFKNKLRQITEDYPCQPDPGLFGNFIGINGFKKGSNSQTGGLTVYMLHISNILGRPDRVVTRKELESLIGRLNCASYVIPLSRHFLSNLRSKLQTKTRPDLQSNPKPSHNPRTDPRTDPRFTDPRTDPRSTKPRTDPNPAPRPDTASETRSDSRTVFQHVSGFTSNGSAWRLKVRASSLIYGECVSKDVLEFPAMVITLWLTLLECKEQRLKYKLILALGDNTSAVEWLTRTDLAGLDPSLFGVSAVAAGLSLRAFFEVYQHADFEPGGNISGGRKAPMAGKTVRSAKGALAAAILNEFKDHATNLIVRALFLVMGACDYVKTPVPGKTSRVRLGCIHFLSRKRNRIRHDDPNLLTRTKFVTVVFEDQKNGERFKHSSDRIMILGRWKSIAFLDYIRLQVIEWTSCVSGDMISFDNFTDLLDKRITELTKSTQETQWDGIPQMHKKPLQQDACLQLRQLLESGNWLIMTFKPKLIVCY